VSLLAASSMSATTSGRLMVTTVGMRCSLAIMQVLI
jgi:hypothetical protein